MCFSNSSKQQQATSGFVGTPWLKVMISVALNNRKANAYHLKQVLCHFKLPRPFYGRFKIQGVGKKKILIPGCSVIFAGKARYPHPLRIFFPYTFTPNFL